MRRGRVKKNNKDVLSQLNLQQELLLLLMKYVLKAPLSQSEGCYHAKSQVLCLNIATDNCIVFIILQLATVLCL